MPTYEQYMDAARNADMSGDGAGAKRLLELAAESRTSKVGVGEDILRTIPAKARSGIETGIGGFGDAQEMTSNLVQSGARAIGLPESIASGAGSVARNFPFPGAQTTEQIQKATTGVIGENYQPQTKPAKIIGEGVEWGVGAIPGGLPGMGRRAVSGLVGGAASEVAGQATEGTGLEGPARLAAGLAAGSAPGLVEGVVRSAAPNKYNAFRKGVESKEQMKSGASQVYEDLRNSGMVLDGMRGRRFHLGLTTALEKGKFRQSGAKKTSKIAREIGKELERGTFDYGDMVAYRKTLKDIARSEKGPEKAAAVTALKKLDDFTTSLSARDFTGGSLDPQAANAMLKKADNAYRRASVSQDLDSMIEKAQATAGTNYTMAGVHTALKREVKNYALKSKFLKPDERKEMLKFAKGNDATDMLKQLSRFKSAVTSGAGGLIGTGLVGGLTRDPAMAAYAQAGTQGGLYAMGMAASKAAERDAMRKIQSLDLMVRSGRIPPEQRADMVRRILGEAMGATARGAYTGMGNEEMN